MSKERAIRRAVRDAEAAKARAARERAATRKAMRRQLLHRVTPRRPEHRVGKLYPRRSYGERVMIILAIVVALGLIWIYVASFATRVALSATLLIVAPAIIVVAFGRRSH
jgi:preprotein translocase subunit SecF